MKLNNLFLKVANGSVGLQGIVPNQHHSDIVCITTFWQCIKI